MRREKQSFVGDGNFQDKTTMVEAVQSFDLLPLGTEKGVNDVKIGHEKPNVLSVWKSIKV